MRRTTCARDAGLLTLVGGFSSSAIIFEVELVDFQKLPERDRELYGTNKDELKRMIEVSFRRKDAELSHVRINLYLRRHNQLRPHLNDVDSPSRYLIPERYCERIPGSEKTIYRLLSQNVFPLRYFPTP